MAAEPSTDPARRLARGGSRYSRGKPWASEAPHGVCTECLGALVLMPGKYGGWKHIGGKRDHRPVPKG